MLKGVKIAREEIYFGRGQGGVKSKASFVLKHFLERAKMILEVRLS